MVDPTHSPTIAALATAPGQAAIAIVRLSGPEAWSIAKTLFNKPNLTLEPGRVCHGWVVDAFTSGNGDGPPVVDEVLLLPFKAPQSVTGEDVVEIHGHGGEYVSRRILELCFEAGALPAAPGEFTKRAFLNGKIDLTQAESVMDLISAQGETLLRVASGNLRARTLGQGLDALRETLVNIQSQIVASVDFPDEVDEPARESLIEQLQAVSQHAQVMAEASQKNRLAREGLQVAILGMPNAGKSSLFNALLAMERAIVTDLPGTTRDVITETLSIRGVPVTLVDTAGIRESEHHVEVLGIERSWQAAESAHAILYIVDATQLPAEGFLPEDEAVLRRLAQSPVHKHVLKIANKIDRISTPQSRVDILSASATTGEGLAEVYQWLEGVVRESTQGTDQALTLLLNHRQLDCLNAMLTHLSLARETLGNPALPLDLTTVPLSDALRKLDELQGRDATEAVLDQVFSQFCVGK